jgi:hypothetical protein
MAYGNYAPFYRGGFFNPMQTQPMPQMADNQGQFSQPYQTPMQTNTAPMPIPSQPINDMIWVLNENEATSYPVAPNNSVVLWDKNNPTIYVKSVNAQGMPSMRILDFTERNADTSNSHENASIKHECTCGDKFVTKEEFDALKGKFYDLQARYDEKMLEEKEKPVEKPKTTIKKAKESEE